MEWQDIATAPVPAREILKFDRWPCLLQNKQGNVVSGYAAYITERNNQNKTRSHKKKPETFRVQWYAGENPTASLNRVFAPIYWMHKPEPRMDHELSQV